MLDLSSTSPSSLADRQPDSARSDDFPSRFSARFLAASEDDRFSSNTITAKRGYLRGRERY